MDPKALDNSMESKASALENSMESKASALENSIWSPKRRTKPWIPSPVQS
jgi:hypothetical protein